MAGALEIHVFGGSVGECIVVGLPNGLWGVVDCYIPDAKDPKNSMIVKFLESRGIDRLEFLCLTHPHEDHVRGINYLVENFAIARFWTFGALTHLQLFKKISKLLESKVATLNDNEDDKNYVDGLLNALGTVYERAKKRSLDLQRLTLGLQLYDIGTGPAFKIVAIGPSARSAVSYEDSLDACFDKNGHGQFLADKVIGVNHNQISSGLLIKYGQTRVILGGDIEKDGWLDVLSHPSLLPLQSQMVKVSHHGSVNGYCDQLWEDHLSPGKAACAVVTAFSKRQLPRPEGILHIRSHAKFVSTTSKSAIKGLKQGSGSMEVFGGLSADAVIALNAVFSSARNKAARLEGACSFSFDENGGYKIEMSGDAAVI